MRPLPRLTARQLKRCTWASAAFGIGLLLLTWHGVSAASSDAGRPIPPPVVDEQAPSSSRAIAVFAGGCFWGVQGIFQHVAGVSAAVSGYAGGNAQTAHYDAVSSGFTGHAESVAVTYDPRQISYGRLLQIYFSVAHDPTQTDRQGPDFGPQYRSAIFPVSPEQAHVATAYIDQLSQMKVFPKAIATRIESGKTFFPAEAYHQDYLTLHPNNPYIVVNDLPKVKELQHFFPEIYHADPVLVANSRETN